VNDLPVGKDIHDQPVVGLTFVINNNSRSLIYDPERDLTSETLRIYNAFGDGMQNYIKKNSSALFFKIY